MVASLAGPRRFPIVLGIVLGAGLGGCGQPGPPLPPSANLPRPAQDLRVERLGPELQLTWTPPTLTTDGARIRGPVAVEYCPQTELRSPAPATANPPAPAGEASPPVCDSPQPLAPPASPPPGTTELALAAYEKAAPRSAGRAGIAIAFRNERNRLSDWSKVAWFSALPVAPPPSDFTAVSTAEGVRLHWQPPSPPAEHLHVYRQTVGGAAPAARRTGPGSLEVPLPGPSRNPAPLLPLATLDGGAVEYLDRDAEWDQTYRYWLRSVARSGDTAAESADSNQVTVQTPNVFPPPAPTGLQALLSPGQPPGVELSWEEAASPNLAGFYVYRRVGGADWLRLNAQAVPTPVFHDSAAGLAPGTEIEYAVSAVGRNGAESERSAPVSIQIPDGGI